MTEQRYQMGDNAGVNDHLYLLVPSIGQVRQSPHSVDQDLQEEKDNHRLFSTAFYKAKEFNTTCSAGPLR